MFKKLKNALVNATAEEMSNYVAGYKAGNVDIKEFTGLSSELFTLTTKAKEEFVVANENNLTVVLDVTLDRELMLEDLARELIRSAQVMRKSANFNVEDRIILEFVTTSADLNEIIAKFSDKIKAELLAKDITTIDNPEYSETVEIGEEEITIKLKR